jgi:hypothetical protein
VSNDLSRYLTYIYVLNAQFLAANNQTLWRGIKDQLADIKVSERTDESKQEDILRRHGGLRRYPSTTWWLEKISFDDMVA